MATQAKVTIAIDLDLKILEAEVGDLPEVAAGWAADPEGAQIAYTLEWSNLMAILEALDREYRSGTMTPEQQARYCRLLRQMAAVLPIIHRLDLTLPPIPLEG